MFNTPNSFKTFSIPPIPTFSNVVVPKLSFKVKSITTSKGLGINFIFKIVSFPFKTLSISSAPLLINVNCLEFKTVSFSPLFKL